MESQSDSQTGPGGYTLPQRLLAAVTLGSVLVLAYVCLDITLNGKLTGLSTGAPDGDA